jgi:hypothetical protein
MRSKIVQDILDRITPEKHAEYKKQMEEGIAFQDILYEQGYRYNTDKSYSLKLLNDAGHFPIGITIMMCEETFIFKTEKEANKAWKSRVLGNDGWFYGKRNFQKALEQYEKNMGHKNEIFWLDGK